MTGAAPMCGSGSGVCLDSRDTTSLPVVAGGGEAARVPDDDSERRIELLIARLPVSFQKFARWLRQPSSRWVRIPVGILLIIGSFLFILPLFGLWMLPLGMVMLAQDVPFIKRLIDHLLAWIERKHPKWLGLPAR